MIVRDPSKRRAASLLARCGVVFSVVGLGISAWNMSFSGVPLAGAAATNAGEVAVVQPVESGPDAGQPLASGGSSTPFSLKLPAGAACTFDTPNSDYRVQSYMVPESVSPAELTYDSAGPTPANYGGAHADFRMPLWGVNENPYVDRGTAAADPAPGPGPVVDIPSLSFGTYIPLGAGAIPPGTYNVGIACTNAEREGDKFWNTRLTFTADTSDPLGVVWAVAEGGGGTTTTTAGGTTTTIDGGTTTTIDGGTTTTTTGVIVKVGPPLTLSSDTVSPGGSLTIDATGWQAGSEVDIAIDSSSDAVVLGTLTAGTDGNVSGSVTIPSDTEAGLHTIAALGVDGEGALMASSAKVTVESTAVPTGGTPSAASPVTIAGQLPYTGSSPIPTVAWALALVVFGRMAMLLGKRPKVVGDDPTG